MSVSEQLDRVREELWWKVGGSLLVVVFLLFWAWILFLNHTDINEIGVAYDSRNGKVWVQAEPGWYRTSLFVKVAYISTLPQRVEIPSEAKVINVKYVRFKPEGIDEYIRRQGFSYGLNSGLNNVLLGYAFSGREWPFMEITQEETEPESGQVRPLPRK